MLHKQALVLIPETLKATMTLNNNFTFSLHALISTHWEILKKISGIFTEITAGWMLLLFTLLLP